MKTNFVSKHYFMFLMMIVLFSNCMNIEDTEFEEQVKFDDKLITEYLESNNISATKDNTSGMYYEVLKENASGSPVEQDDIISIRYVMKTLGGKLIDSLSMTEAVDTVVRFEHSLNTQYASLYPEGINYGVRLMNEGEKFRFYIPSYLAFRQYAYKTLLPSEAVLIVDTEVVKVESEEEINAQEKQAIQQYITDNQLEDVSEKASGIFYQKLIEGTGEVVKQGQAIEVAYKGMFLNKKVFDQTESGKTYSLTIGYTEVIKGFEEGIKLMKRGEKARIFIPSELAYGPSVQVIPGVIRKDYLTKAYGRELISPFKTLIFEVELKDVK